MGDFLANEYNSEMQEMADGIGASFGEVAVYNTWPAVINHSFVSCCGAAALDSATTDYELYHMRNLDILNPGQGIHDVETGKLFEIFKFRNVSVCY